MDTNDCSLPLHPEAVHGLALFNTGEYFEAHEALENAWRDEPGAVRELYQGILQVAVTYLHIQRGNYEGATKVAMRCQRKLENWPDHCRGVDVAALRLDLAAVMQMLVRLGPEHINSFDPGFFKAVIYER